MNRLRLTMVFEFDYHGNLVEATVDRLAENFLKDPTNFIHPDELEWDEVLVVDIQNITEEDNG